MRFVDLFAGLGGFHLALRGLGHECVFACELDAGLRTLYRSNFGLSEEQVKGDILKIDATEVPHHDILCAGFPCQPYSKAGNRQGPRCPRWGALFQEVLRIIRHHQPRYVILENVANLEGHDKGQTWELMRQQLESAFEPRNAAERRSSRGYHVETRRLSPHLFGIPQVRDRFLIVASREPIPQFHTQFERLTAERQGQVPDVRQVLETDPVDAKFITEQRTQCIQLWQEMLELLPGVRIPSPLWGMEFDATYPYETTTPHALSLDELRAYAGSHGQSLREMTSKEELFKALPSHARTEQAQFPPWKVGFIRDSREFYAEHRDVLAPWRERLLRFPPSLQKLEWNVGDGERNIWDYIIQFRASGVRVKRPTTAPSLIAMTTTQVPIIGWERRYMTTTECVRLQSMEELPNLPPASTNAYKALGNAVNVSLVEWVAQALFAGHEPLPCAAEVEEATPVPPLENVALPRIARREMVPA